MSPREQAVPAEQTIPTPQPAPARPTQPTRPAPAAPLPQIDLTAAAREPARGHTSKGDQPKWQQGGLWYKADHMGCEALAEVAVSRLLQKTNVPDFVRYDPIRIRYEGGTAPGCVSRNFRSRQEMLVPLERLHRAYRGRGLAAALADFAGPEAAIRYTVEFVETATGLRGVGPALTQLLELDMVFLNEDRHTNNLAVLRDEQTGTFRLCPVFDNGLALLADLHDYPLTRDLYECIAAAEAKPFARSFEAQVDAAERLYGVQLTLSFQSADIPAALAGLDALYSRPVLARAEQLLREQLRRYAAYRKPAP